MNKTRFDGLIYIRNRLQNGRGASERELLKYGITLDSAIEYLDKNTNYSYKVISVSSSKYIVSKEDGNADVTILKDTLEAYAGNKTLEETTTLHEAKAIKDKGSE